MHILLVGSGGREHALAWKLSFSARVERVWVAPGNGGTERLPKVENLAIGVEDSAALLNFASQKEIDLTVIGPEAPLTAGIVDLFTEKGLKILGPSRAAAELEWSKVFAKDFMSRHGIPTARYATFREPAAARRYLQTLDHPVVVKASGLAAGKGVILAENTEDALAAVEHMMVERVFGPAGDEVVIEERLSGQEVSVLAFSDGKDIQLLPPAQDHKPIFDDDLGPNTGGMGAYAPAPIATEALMETVHAQVLQPAVDGMRREGRPYVGVLYAGLMLTADGPKVLEFNCRLGDPETQALLPLLQSDLVDVMLACVEGRLADEKMSWRAGAAVCLVLASLGYPGAYRKGLPIRGLEKLMGREDVLVFHAGTRREGQEVLTAGGRVLNLTAWGADLPEAIEKAYEAVGLIHFEGIYYRRDIGAKGLVYSREGAI